MEILSCENTILVRRVAGEDSFSTTSLEAARDAHLLRGGRVEGGSIDLVQVSPVSVKLVVLPGILAGLLSAE